MLVELLMALSAQLVGLVGVTGMKIVFVLGLILLVGGTILFINWAFEYLFDIRVAQGTILRRRQQYADAVLEKEARRKVEIFGALHRKAAKLDAPRLERWCKEHPQDWAAFYRLSELYEASGDFINFVRYREKVLKEMPRKGTGPEMATEWHHLADVYLQELKDLEGARLGLEYFAHQFSMTPEAKLARQRIDRMTGNLPPKPAEGSTEAAPPENIVVHSRKRLPPEI